MRECYRATPEAQRVCPPGSQTQLHVCDAGVTTSLCGFAMGLPQQFKDIVTRTTMNNGGSGREGGREGKAFPAGPHSGPPARLDPHLPGQGFRAPPGRAAHRTPRGPTSEPLRGAPARQPIGSRVLRPPSAERPCLPSAVAFYDSFPA